MASIVVRKAGEKFAVYASTSGEGSVLLRVVDTDDKALAEQVAEHIREAIRVKITRADCQYCGGVGGCYNCDS